MEKNDQLTVLIEGYNSEGAGVAKPDGYVLFIPGTIVGEEVVAHITRANKNYGYAKAIEILKPSKDRKTPECSKATACGGCQLWHMSYDCQLRFKKQKVCDNMRKAGIDCPVDDTLPSPSQMAYRNKAQYPIRNQNGQITGGFYRQNSHTVIECKCVIQPPVFNEILNYVISLMTEFGVTAYDEISAKGLLRHLYLRANSDRSEIMLCLVLNGKNTLKKEFFDKLLVKFPAISTICINYNTEKTNVVLGKRYEVVYGKGYITDTLLGKKFEISPESFYQVNHDGCEVLYSVVKDYVKDATNLLDLYCGIGTIGICTMGEKAKLTGIEIVAKAIENAKRNALLNGIENADFAAMDASASADFAKGDYDTIIVDPPRKGCDVKTLEYLEQKAPKTLVYVSCDSATLARDLAILKQKGFEVKKITPVDMFPQTNHVECVALLRSDINL